MSRRYFGIAVASILIGASYHQSRACTCPMRPPVSIAAESADLILRGTVVNIVDMSDSAECAAAGQGVPPPPDEFAAYCGYSVTFRVDAGWKGAQSPKMTVVTGTGGGDCGTRFATGKQYIVFARQLKRGALYTDTCTYTAEVAASVKVIKELGLPKWRPSA
jgi:hypothetical protein